MPAARSGPRPIPESGAEAPPAVGFVAVAILAAIVAVPVGSVLGWLLPPTSGPHATAGFVTGRWLALTVAGTAVVALVGQRPSRYVTVPVLASVAAQLLCAAQAGGFGTFAINHVPTGVVRIGEQSKGARG